MDNSEVQERCCKPIGSDYAPQIPRKKVSVWISCTCCHSSCQGPSCGGQRIVKDNPVKEARPELQLREKRCTMQQARFQEYAYFFITWRMNKPFQPFPFPFISGLLLKTFQKGFWCKPLLLFHKQADHLQAIHYAEIKFQLLLLELLVVTMTYSLEKRLELGLVYTTNTCPEWGRKMRDLNCFLP